MYRPASAGFPVPASPIFFARDRSKSALARPRRDLETPLLSHTEDIEEELETQAEPQTKMIRNKRDFLILVALCLSYYNAFAAFSMIAPIYPLEAKKFGMGESLSGLVFAIYPLMVFLASPFVGKWMPKMGVKFALISGGFISGGSNILFGFLGKLEARDNNGKITSNSYLQFVIFSFVLRITMAIGCALNETAAVSIMTVSFKHALATAQGSIALFTGLGLMSGPALGSALYQAGNNSFLLPFAVVGGLVWLIILMIAFILPPEEVFHMKCTAGEEEEENTFWKVFFIPGIFMMSTVTLVAGMVISFLDPTLTPFVTSLEPTLKPFWVGLIFLCAPLTYAITTPLLGRLLDKEIIRGRYASIVGCFLGFICYMFMAPSPIFFFIKKGHLWLTVTSLLLLGCLCLTAMFVPVLADMQIVAKNAGLPLNLSTDAILSGIYTSMFYIGSIVGPSLGAFLTEHLGFRKASTIFSFILLLEGVCLLLFTIWENKYGKRTTQSEDEVKWTQYTEPADDNINSS